MSEERLDADRNIGEPPTQAETQLAKDLIQLDSLRAQGDAKKVQQFLGGHPMVRALDRARHKIMRIGVLAPEPDLVKPKSPPEDAEHLEGFHRKLMEAWRAAEEAVFNARQQTYRNSREDEVIFNNILTQAFETDYKGQIKFRWDQEIYMIVEYAGKAFILVNSNRVNQHDVLFTKFFEPSPDYKEFDDKKPEYKLVKAAMFSEERRPTPPYEPYYAENERDLLDSKKKGTLLKLGGYMMKRGQVLAK